ncbi:LacI family DNA-binding transcriptional regulator [Exiguobacterium oxidotolerans]|uniref:LacI family DNA-binding transcriptional regulator n=1 Tax=Exiguobacterium oxidotolerans TaxID=223958 RepID=UPI00049431DC|nr:LacI family DNA-binding transcriptional regulator [Exiguobacterium oxidotolerans]
MANITEIAKTAGVSRSTVSRVLNNQPYVIAEKREAVLRAMKLLDYRPNQNAVHLSRGKTNVIGVMVPQINHPFFSQLIEGIGIACAEQNISMLIHQTFNDRQQEQLSFTQLRHKQIDGLIIGSSVSPPEVLERVRRDGPVVICEQREESLAQVAVDHQSGVLAVLSHLVEKGHSSLGLCLGNPASGVGLIRRHTFKAFVQEHGLLVSPDWYFEENYSFADGQKVMNQLLTLTDRPTAMIVGNDYVAAGIIHQAKQEGVKIPDMLAVTGFDNQAIAEAIGMTTVAQPIERLGKEAVQVLNQLIRGKEMPVSQPMPLELIVRGTT